VSSSSSSSEDAEVSLCSKAKEEYESSTVSSNFSINVENYSQLLEAFKETHEEANRLAHVSNKLKGLNKWLETKVKTLEEELENSRNDFETLELIYKNSSCECDSSFCKNYESLENKIHYLVKTVDKHSKGKSNFENVLTSQNCVFGKSGLSLNPHSKNSGISKSFSTIAEKQPIDKLNNWLFLAFIV